MPSLFVCRRCGKTFTRYPSGIKRGQGKYCSMACYRPPLLSHCATCGTMFSTMPSRLKTGRGRYCSHSCARRSRLITSRCHHCGTSFIQRPSQRKDGYGRYCSKSCSNRARSPSLQRTCRRCGTIFEKNRFAVEHGQGVYCSKTCQFPGHDPLHPKPRGTTRDKWQTWIRVNPKRAAETRRAKEKRRRARKLMAPQNDLTAAQWREIKAAFKFRCAYCGVKPKRLEQDHVVPLSKGGNHTASNIVPACGPCNRHKHTGPPPVPVQPLLLTVSRARRSS